MESDYTLISIIAIIALAMVVISCVSIVALVVHTYEKLKMETETKINAELQDGKVITETNLNIDGEKK